MLIQKCELFYGTINSDFFRVKKNKYILYVELGQNKTLELEAFII